MNRSDFQQLSELRLKEVQALLGDQYFDGAYYLLGYALEFAFKACIAKQTKEHDFPPDRKAVEAIYKHRPSELLKLQIWNRSTTRQSRQAQHLRTTGRQSNFGRNNLDTKLVNPRMKWQTSYQRWWPMKEY